MEQMMTRYNVNVKPIITSNNVQCNNVKTEVDRIADLLVEKLKNPGARKYYCKVAYKLPEATIWQNVEQALTGDSPQRYFTWLCQKSLTI